MEMESPTLSIGHRPNGGFSNMDSGVCQVFFLCPIRMLRRCIAHGFVKFCSLSSVVDESEA